VLAQLDTIDLLATRQVVTVGSVRYTFVGYELDTDAYKLSHLTREGSQELRLQPQVFDVLRYLVEHRERVVSKDELLGALWPDAHVNEAAVTWSISHARRALGQTRGDKLPIETVHGRGYRFAADVQVLDAAPGSSAPLREPVRPAPPTAAQPQPAPALHAAALPFVGRSELMAQLQAQLLEAQSGAGHLCLLAGEAGIGKTRCATELATFARQRGVTVLSGRSVEGVGAPVFWPWQQILRELVQAVPSLRPQGSTLLTQLSAAEPGGGDRESIRPATSAGRVRIFDEVTRLLLQAAAITPLLLIFDDLHWADAGTIELLCFAAPEFARARLMVLGTQREDMMLHSGRTSSLLSRRAQTFSVAYLTQQDIAHYIASATQQEPSNELSAAVLAATAGNPLFVQETVRSLATHSGAAALQKLTASAIQPSKLARDVLRVPLQALDPQARALLSTASVLGEVFELTLLTQVAELDIDSLLDRLDAALARGFVLAEAPNRYRFQHALVRTILYDDVKPTERVATHRRAAQVLSQFPDRDEHASEIAIHYYRSLAAGDPGAVTAAAIRAAQAAERAHAYQDATMFYEWALEAQALDLSVTSRARAELLLRCGRVQRWAGREEDTRHTLKQTISLASKDGFGDLLVRAARVLRPVHALGTLPDELVRQALEQALRTAPPGAHPQRIGALSQLASLPPIACDLEQSKETSALALSLARERLAVRTPDSEYNEREAKLSMFEALRARLYSLSGPDDIDALLAVCDEIVALDRPLSDVSWEAHMARFGALIYRGDLKAASVVLEGMGHLGDELKMPETRWFYERQRVQAQLLRGHFAEALDACEALSASSARMGLSYGNLLVAGIRTAVNLFRNGAEALKIHIDLSGATWPGELPRLLWSYGVLFAAEAGDLDAARRNWQTLARHDFDDVPKEISYLLTLCNSAAVAALLDDKPRAEKLYQLLTPYPHHNTPDLMLFHHGSVSHFLALLAATTGRDNRVEDHFQAALAMNERIEHLPQLARTCYEYAEWLRARPETSAQERGRAMGRRACELAQRLGMAWLYERARVLA
jgi:DNA-binding winged helix-turn-helix (wHTH) protein/tetratricopeptide (TPR) repeat protein